MNLCVNFLGDGLFEAIKEENSKLRPSFNYTDCHAQVFGSPDVYPTYSETTLDINDYIPEQYSKFCAERDINNTVLIQPECYGRKRIRGTYLRGCYRRIICHGPGREWFDLGGS